MGVSRILVVDDDPGVRDLLATTLRLEGHEVVAVADGATALERLRTETVDVVLLDRRLPGMDGLEVLAAIRADPELTLVPVVLVTALDDPDATVEGLDRGADDYVTKPFVPEEMAARVRAHLRGQRAWVERLTATVTRRRSVLATAAAAAGGVRSLPGAARALCDGLLAEPALAGIEIVEVAGGRMHRLGAAGRPGLGLLHLADAADDLLAIQQGLPDGPRQIDLPDHVVTAAPVRDGIAGLAVVVAVGNPTVRSGAADALLALTIDAASTTAGVLTEPLRASHLRADAREHIQRIVRDRAFHPVFQPIIDLNAGTVVCHEALSRFDGGLDPAEVFGTALRLGVGAQLEQATLHASVEAAARHQPPGCSLALNVTPSLLLGSVDLDVVLDIAGDRELVLEISEMEPVTDYGALRRAIQDLGATVRISVDDAGAGFASLAHILALEAQYVKLDKSWVQGIDVDPARRALVAGLQSFARETGAVLIAEGVETETQLDVIRHLGIAYGQGWLLGMPEPL